MSRRVRVSDQAKTDLDEIWDYVARKQSIDAATRLMDSITRRFPMLGRHTGVGRHRDDFEPGALCFPVEECVIYYRRRKAGIEISHIIHGKRDQKKAWEE